MLTLPRLCDVGRKSITPAIDPFQSARPATEGRSIAKRHLEIKGNFEEYLWLLPMLILLLLLLLLVLLLLRSLPLVIGYVALFKSGAGRSRGQGWRAGDESLR